MELHGSCYCKRVQFSARSHTPYPYMRCYCSMCRKTAGGGGYAINIMVDAGSMEVAGEGFIEAHDNWVDDEDHPGKMKKSPGEGYFCRCCGSALWQADPRWPELLHPYSSAIDTLLPIPPERVHIMLDFAAPWVRIPEGPGERHFRRYPDESIEEWHRRHGLYERYKAAVSVYCGSL